MARIAPGVPALALLALVFGSDAHAAPGTYVVARGDTLWELGRAHGCSVAELRAANDLGPNDALVVGRKLDLSACADAGGAAPRSATRRYRVVTGDTLSAIAKRHGTSVDELRRLNELEGSLIRVGQELRLPAARERVVRRKPGQSRGRVDHGWLHSGSRLPADKAYYRRRVERTWAAAHLIDHTLNAIHDVRDRFPGVHRLAIGDLSDRDGGPLSGHASHQSGRDIDLGFYFHRVPAGYPKQFVVASKDQLDADATWALLEGFVRTHGQPGGVEKVFLDYEIQGWLYAAARRDGWSKRRLKDVFQYPDGPGAKHGMVRHLRGHADHLHIRFRCLPQARSCQG